MKIAPGATLPEGSRRWAKAQGLYWSYYRGRWVLRRNNNRPQLKPTFRQRQQREEFTRLAWATKHVLPADRVYAEAIARHTQLVWRDVLTLMMIGRLAIIDGALPDMAYPDLDMVGTRPGSLLVRELANWLPLVPAEDGKVLTLTGGLPRWMNPTAATTVERLLALLDEIDDTPGAVLVRGPSTWQVLLPPTADKFLAFDIATHLPVWVDGSTGINQLTGDVTAGPGSGSVAATLANTGVAAGTYNLIQVDAKGRALAGSVVAYLTGNQNITVSGDATGSGATAIALTLANSGVTAGTYTSITVDAKGRATGGTNPGFLTGNQNITLSGDITGSGTTAITTALSTTGVTAGSYTNVNVTVDAAGRITSISNGTGGGGGVGGLFSGLIGSASPTESSIGMGTHFNLSPATIADVTTGVLIKCTTAGSSAHNMRGTKGNVPSAPYTMDFLLLIDTTGADFSGAGIGWTDGTKFDTAYIQDDHFYHSTWNSSSSNNTNTLVTGLDGRNVHMVWIRLQDDNAGNIFCGFSFSGEAYQTLFTGAKSGQFLGSTGYTAYAFFVDNHSRAIAAVVGGFRQTSP